MPFIAFKTRRGIVKFKVRARKKATWALPAHLRPFTFGGSDPRSKSARRKAKKAYASYRAHGKRRNPSFWAVKGGRVRRVHFEAKTPSTPSSWFGPFSRSKKGSLAGQMRKITGRRNPTVCFRTKRGKKVMFKARKTASPAKGSCRRKGTWPKGKVPKHLKKYLFR